MTKGMRHSDQACNRSSVFHARYDLGQVILSFWEFPFHRFKAIASKTQKVITLFPGSQRITAGTGRGTGMPEDLRGQERWTAVPDRSIRAASTKIAAADVSGLPEDKGWQERGRRGRNAETVVKRRGDTLNQERNWNTASLCQKHPLRSLPFPVRRVPLPLRSCGQQGQVTVFRTRPRPGGASYLQATPPIRRFCS